MTRKAVTAQLAQRMVVLHAELTRKAHAANNVPGVQFHARRTTHWSAAQREASTGTRLGVHAVGRRANGAITYRIYRDPRAGVSSGDFRDVTLSPRMRSVLPSGLNSARGLIVADGRTRNSLLSRLLADKVPGRLVALSPEGRRLAYFLNAGQQP